MRVLQFVTSLESGGVETWLLRMRRFVNPSMLGIDFVVADPKEGLYEGELRRYHGCRIYRLPQKRRLVRFVLALGVLLRQEGKQYDLIHVHYGLHAGIVCLFSKIVRHRLPVVAHSHEDARLYEGSGPRRIVSEFARRVSVCLIALGADGLAACSEKAALSRFGVFWYRKSHWILPYGVDCERFVPQRRDAHARIQRGLPPGSPLIGHVGRLVPEKNHSFLLRCFSSLAGRLGEGQLVIIGDGPEKEAIEHEIERLGLRGRVTLLSPRVDVSEDIAQLDLMLFPSTQEGLGMVVVEAQAAGVPVVASSAVPSGAVVVEELVKRLELTQAVEEWARIIEDMLSTVFDRQRANRQVQASSFSLEGSAQTLLSMYRALAGSSA